MAKKQTAKTKSTKNKYITVESLILNLESYKRFAWTQTQKNNLSNINSLNDKKQDKHQEQDQEQQPITEEDLKKYMINEYDIIKHNNSLFTRSEYTSYKNAKTKIIVENPKHLNSEHDNDFKLMKLDHDPLKKFSKLTNVQESILSRINKLKLRGSYVFTASCGAGKTRAAMKIIEQLKVKTLIISSRNSVNDQWLKELSEEYPNLIIERRLDDKKSNDVLNRYADIYIMTPQYITRNFITENKKLYKTIKIDLIIYDELHSLTSVEFGKVLLLPFIMKRYNILKYLPLLIGLTATIPKSDSIEFKLIQKIFGDPIESVDLIRNIRVDYTDYRDTQHLGKFDNNFIPLEDNEACVLYLQTMLNKGFDPTINRKLLIVTSTIDSSVFAAIQASLTFQKPVLLIRAANEKSIFIKSTPEDYDYIYTIEKAGHLTDDDPEYTVPELKYLERKNKDIIIECDYMDYINKSCIIVGTYHRLLEGFNCKEFVYGICTKFIWSPLKRVQLLGRIRRSSEDKNLNSHKRIFFVNSCKIPTNMLNPNRIKRHEPIKILYDEQFEQILFEKENYHKVSIDEIDQSYTTDI